MTIVSTSTFRTALQRLTKREASGYSSCCPDICDTFRDASFDDIFNRHFLVKESGAVRVIKLRIPNSHLRLSSAAGFRLIIVCNRKHNHIALLEVYPKRGKYSKTDLLKNEYREILNSYGAELKSNSLVVHDLAHNLAVIVRNDI